MAARLASLRLAALTVIFCTTSVVAQPIDRHALVSRHDVVLTEVDRHAPLMIGNGSLGFTADITGLQTFPERYSDLAPLLTMAQWAWHSFPNPKGYREEDGMVMVPVPGRGEQPYPWIRDWSELDTRPALKWLRENPHRFSLGRVALALSHADGSPATFGEISQTRQELDLWTGALLSSFVFDGRTVSVETRMHSGRDLLLVRVRSPLVREGRLGIDVLYPGVAANLNPDPSDWSNPNGHRTIVRSSGPDTLMLERRIGDSVYHSAISAPAAGVRVAGPHHVRIGGAKSDEIIATIGFEREAAPLPRLSFAESIAAVDRHWRTFWSRGGAVDLSGSSDPRAAELERRVVLSQYLSALNGAGMVPPQEEGLFSNSWNGKFHLEMHPLHSAHWAQWGRPELLERSLGWYLDNLERAKAEARRHGVEGAWWTKMTGPEARNSPSTINPFIMWQQPHPIYMAELVYRARPEAAVLARYAELVEETGKLLAGWPRWIESERRYVLGPPIIPVQENHPPLATVNPLFELEYFRWGLETAQKWRERRGLVRDPQWDRVIAGLSPPPMRDGLYLPAESAPDFWRTASSPSCSRNAVAPQCPNRDHPSFAMAWGYIGGSRTDPAVMARTFAAMRAHWDLRQTWGWDSPMMAMTAARLGDPEGAVDWLFAELPNNRWGTTGMTPRFHLEAHAADLFPRDGQAGEGEEPGYRRSAETYFPSNGSLLLAVGMMAAGWDGSEGEAPGFPRDWNVKAEGIRPLP